MLYFYRLADQAEYKLYNVIVYYSFSSCNIKMILTH